MSRSVVYGEEKMHEASSACFVDIVSYDEGKGFFWQARRYWRAGRELEERGFAVWFSTATGKLRLDSVWTRPM
jgi:hypothetical protein